MGNDTGNMVARNRELPVFILHTGLGIFRDVQNTPIDGMFQFALEVGRIVGDGAVHKGVIRDAGVRLHLPLFLHACPQRCHASIHLDACACITQGKQDVVLALLLSFTIGLSLLAAAVLGLEPFSFVEAC